MLPNTKGAPNFLNLRSKKLKKYLWVEIQEIASPFGISLCRDSDKEV